MSALIKKTPLSSFVITNKATDVAQMTEWLNTELNRLEVSDDVLYKFDLCANEIVANIISYAFPEGSDHKISLSLSANPKEVNLEVQDDGIAFNPLDVPEHVQPSNIEEAEVGGLGIDIVRHFMGGLVYQRQQGINILRMTAPL